MLAGINNLIDVPHVLESALEALQVEQEVATLDPVSKIWRLFDDLSVYQQHKVRMRRSRQW